MKAIGYPRVSTDDQFRGGVSIGAQAERMQAYAVAQDLGELEIRAEGKTAKDVAHRPVLKGILEEVGRGEVSALLVFKLDRLARNTIEALELAEYLRAHGCRLVSLSETIDTGSAFGTFFYTVLAALAQMERGVTAERTKLAAERKLRLGESWGRGVYGWDAVDGQLRRNDGEQRVLDELRTAREGGQSFHALAVALQERGVRTKRGGRWAAATVRSVLRSSAHVEANIGRAQS